jgi:hypothetical protein
MNPSIKFADGKLIAIGAVGVDADKDGIKSVQIEAKIQIDATEAITEIYKDAPTWLLALVDKLQGKKEEQV